MICIGIGETRTVDNVRVTFLDANHCPGAAMIVFQLRGGRVSMPSLECHLLFLSLLKISGFLGGRGARQNVLHTGDFRFHPKMRSCELLALPRFNTVILDTTYCNPEYDFPGQEKVPSCFCFFKKKNQSVHALNCQLTVSSVTTFRLTLLALIDH